jgi:signal transduction histidine kinase
MIEQALTNLIDNALKYSDPGNKVQVWIEERDSSVEISVADKGIGIARKDISRVFERFYRTDSARGKEPGGTGLGLAIVKHIALAHNGNVRVESALGAGSTFTLSLPLSR